MADYTVLNLTNNTVTVRYTDSEQDIVVTQTLTLPVLDSETWESEVLDIVVNNYPRSAIVNELASRVSFQIPDSDKDAFAGEHGEIPRSVSEGTYPSGITADEYGSANYLRKTFGDVVNAGVIWTDSETLESFSIEPRPGHYLEAVSALDGTRTSGDKILLSKINSIDEVTDYRNRQVGEFVNRSTTNKEVSDYTKEARQLNLYTAEMYLTLAEGLKDGPADGGLQTNFTNSRANTPALKRQAEIVKVSNKEIFESAKAGIYKKFGDVLAITRELTNIKTEIVNFNSYSTANSYTLGSTDITSLQPDINLGDTATMIDGSLENGASYDSDAKAAILNGNQHFIQTDDLIDYDSDGRFSISIWFKGTSAGDHRTLLQERNGTTDSNPIINIIGNEYFVGLWSGAFPPFARIITTTSPYSAGVVQNVVVTYDTDRLALYIDGELAGEATGVSRTLIGGDSHFFRIGGDDNNQVNNFGWSSVDNDLSGEYYLIKYWPEALDSDTVIANYAFENQLTDKI